MSSSNPRPTRDQQREAAREKAKMLREQNQKKEKRSKLALQLGVAAAALAIIGGVAGAIWYESANRVAAPVVEDAPANLSKEGGLKIGVGLQAFTADKTPTADAAGSVPEIIMYVDYQCPVCQGFDVPNSAQMRSWVDTGAATLEIRPISFLDRASLNEYSSRAANAAACVANFAPDSYFDFHHLLMQEQPAEGTEGHDDNALYAFAEEAGASSQEIKGCIQNKSFGDWVEQNTERVLTSPAGDVNIQVSGTPTVLVNGKQYTWELPEELVSPERFAQFVQTASAE
jgi:protein-disulfide isomerase